MDPNANLQEQLRIAQRILDASELEDDNILESGDAERLSELVLALDEWITRGGFMPSRWSQK